MGTLRRWWRNAFDVREGEHARTIFLGLYFFFVLCAVHVLKPVATSLFLDRFPIGKLPYLYMAIAVIGGLLAYFYTKLAVNTSLYTAVAGSTLIMVLSLLALWRVLDTKSTWILYIFAIWVNLFGIVFVSQGWLLAANLFDGREAKRIYGLLGLGAIVGSAAGGALTVVGAMESGSKALLPLGIVLILLAFGSLHAAALAERRRTGLNPRERFRPSKRDQDGERELAEFSLHDVIAAVTRYRHLLVIVGIIIATYVVEVLVEFQFSAMAKQRYSGDELTAFLGTFNGIYLSAVTFVLQFFFTTLIVGRLGVGRTLLVSPVSVGAASLGVLVAPGLLSVAITRLLEASTRYSISRTALELLYLPLPTELKNRTKAFVDVFVDRLGRGIAALLLLLLTALGLQRPGELAPLVILFALIWIGLALLAKNEYAATVRRRVESRRLDLEGARITVQDSETVGLLERTARGQNTRQVVYALSLLAEAPNYDLRPLLSGLAGTGSPAVRAKVYQLAATLGDPALLERALSEIRPPGSPSEEAAREAAGYAIAVSTDPGSLITEFMNHPSSVVGEAALNALPGDPEQVQRLVSRDWLIEASKSGKPEKRALAAFAVGIRGDEGTDVLHRLLRDTDPRVVEAACRAAGRLKNRDYLREVVDLLSKPAIRGAAIDSIASYGESVCRNLEEILTDSATPAGIRRHIPRALAAIPVQESVGILRRKLSEPDLTIRYAVLKGLNRIRDTSPQLDYGVDQIRDLILSEAHQYYEIYAALSRFRETQPGGRATALLARTIEVRLNRTIERLFRLLGLRYPPKQILAAYLAVSRKRSEEFATALEFLDGILEYDLKSVLLPMIDGSPHLLDIGHEQFGVKLPTLEEALLQQMRVEDTWLAACAVAAVGELRLRSLAKRVEELAGAGDPVIAPVALSAVAALA